MKKRILLLALAAIMCVSLFAGCGNSDLKSKEEDASPSPSAGVGDYEATDTTNFDPVYDSFPPDTVMLTINGIDVTWDELFYWYFYDVMSMESYIGKIENWDEPSEFDATKTYRELIMTDGLQYSKLYSNIQSHATEYGLSLTQEQKDARDATWQSYVDSYESEEALLEDMKTEYMNKERYCFFYEMNILFNTLQEEIFGTNGEKMSEEEILANAKSEGYMAAKHILLMTQDENGERLSDEQVAEQYATAEKLLKELQKISDPAALEAKIDELAQEYSEDTGLTYYPDGYIFQSGEMVEQFEGFVSGAKEYELSGIVETSYGYHIILCLPLRVDVTVEFSSDGSIAYTLGSYASQQGFTKLMETWQEECEVVYSKEYEEMDLAALFAKAIYPPEASEEPVG